MNISESLTVFENDLMVKNRAEKTITAYLQDVKRFLDWSGIISLTQLTQSLIEDYLRYMTQKGLHPHTRSRQRAALVVYVRILSAHLGTTDFSGSIPGISTRPSDPELMTDDDLLAVLYALDENNPIEERDGALIAFLAATGVRREEVAMMKMGDIRLSGNQKNWVAQVPSVKVKGGNNPKVAAFRMRTVNFGNLDQPGDIATCHFGLYYLKRQNQRLGGYHHSLNKPLFSQIADDNKHLHPVNIRTAVKRAMLKRARQEPLMPHLEKFSTHTLRHYYATKCWLNNMDLMVIKHNLGHSSIAVTEKYVHYAENMSGIQAREHGPLRDLKAKSSLRAPNAKELAAVIRRFMQQGAPPV